MAFEFVYATSRTSSSDQTREVVAGSGWNGWILRFTGVIWTVKVSWFGVKSTWISVGQLKSRVSSQGRRRTISICPVWRPGTAWLASNSGGTVRCSSDGRSHSASGCCVRRTGRRLPPPHFGGSQIATCELIRWAARARRRHVCLSTAAWTGELFWANKIGPGREGNSCNTRTLAAVELPGRHNSDAVVVAVAPGCVCGRRCQASGSPSPGRRQRTQHAANRRRCQREPASELANFESYLGPNSGRCSCALFASPVHHCSCCRVVAAAAALTATELVARLSDTPTLLAAIFYSRQLQQQ